MNLDVRHLIKKPCDVISVAASVERACRILPRKGHEFDRRCLIANTLHDAGIPANLKGYVYLIEALDHIIANPGTTFAMTQSIYAPIAAQYSVNT